MYIYPKKEQQKAIAPLIKNNRNNLKNVELKNLVKLFTFSSPKVSIWQVKLFWLKSLNIMLFSR